MEEMLEESLARWVSWVGQDSGNQQGRANSVREVNRKIRFGAHGACELSGRKVQQRNTGA